VPTIRLRRFFPTGLLGWNNFRARPYSAAQDRIHRDTPLNGLAKKDLDVYEGCHTLLVQPEIIWDNPRPPGMTGVDLRRQRECGSTSGETKLKYNPLIERAVKSIKVLPAQVDRKRYLRALRYSVKGDDGKPPKAYSPKAIADLTQISVRMLYKFHIIVDRKQAIGFLASLGSEPSHEAFRKRLSADNYKKRFQKGPPSKVGNFYVFTHHEILLLEELTLSIDVPETID
jgi:hypothetical protein